MIVKSPIINYNGQLVKQDNRLSFYNRGFQFGDGIFETLIAENGKVSHLDLHLKRLKNAAEVCRLSIPKIDVEKEVQLVMEANELTSARVKLIVWRVNSDIPGYGSTTQESEYVVFVKPMTGDRVTYITKSEASHSVFLHPSNTSPFKTLSSLPYTLAAIEKKERKLDELFLLDKQMNVAECSSSNLFWVKQDKLFTPPLATGCINGVMRQVIIKNFQVQEQRATLSELEGIQAVFCTNVARLSIFEKFKTDRLDTDHPALSNIKQLWVP